MKDILIGAADLYTRKDVFPWMKSARESGFTGDIYLICYRIDDSVRQAALECSVELYEVEHDAYGLPIQHSTQGSPTRSHNLRFYHAWELLTRMAVEGIHFNHVIMTDVRDVVFQTDPTPWLAANLKDRKLIAPSEHIYFKDEPWNKDNLINGFGKILWDLVGHSWVAHNVGTIAGEAVFMRELFNNIFRMTEGRYYPSDQASFNVLLHTCFREDAVYYSNNWAAQLGTTQDPTKSYLWEKCLERPTIQENGIVMARFNEPYVVCHQWDRVPVLKQFITAKYLNV